MGYIFQQEKTGNSAASMKLTAEASGTPAGKAPRSITIKALTAEWLESRRLEVKDSTLANYRYFLNHYLLPELGKCRTDQMSTQRIIRFSRDMEEKELNPATINKALALLRMILKYAGKRGFALPEQSDIRVLKRKRKNVSILTDNEQRCLLEYLMDDGCPLRPGIRAGILLSLCAGLRIGEVCALKWKNISFRRGTLVVEHTLSRIYTEEGAAEARAAGRKTGGNTRSSRGTSRAKQTKIEISDPKTENSRREIPLAGFLKEELEKLKGDRYVSPEAYVLTGAPWPLEPRTYSYHFQKARQATGISSCNYHMLRHTFATKCLEAGFDVKALSEILGHSNVSTTLNLYAHPTMEMKMSYMEKLGSVYGVGEGQ